MYKANITGKNTLDQAGINTAIEIELFSTKTSETISGIDAVVRSGDAIRFFPSKGLTITLKHSEDKLKLSGATDKKLNGDKGDWIELKKTAAPGYKTNGQAYEINPANITHYVENIDLVSANTDLFYTTLDNGLNFYVAKLDFILANGQTIKKTPTISIGFKAPNYADIVSNMALSGLAANTDYMAKLITEAAKSVPPATRIYIKKNNTAQATKFLINIRLLGYYI